jgi:hypothetical protein
VVERRTLESHRAGVARVARRRRLYVIVIHATRCRAVVAGRTGLRIACVAKRCVRKTHSAGMAGFAGS